MVPLYSFWRARYSIIVSIVVVTSTAITRCGPQFFVNFAARWQHPQNQDLRYTGLHISERGLLLGLATRVSSEWIGSLEVTGESLDKVVRNLPY